MSDPVVFDKKPMVLELEPGEYPWCSCGRSESQPYCDGSHKGSEFKPLVFEVEEKKKVALCNCKMTKTPPYCDGTHKELE